MLRRMSAEPLLSENPAPHPFSIPNYRYLWFSRLASMVALYALLLILGW